LSPSAGGILESLDRLQDALGDAHDLSTLERYFSEHAAVIADKAIRLRMARTIRKEMGRLRRKSLRLGGDLFRGKPKGYLRRLLPGHPSGKTRYRKAA